MNSLVKLSARFELTRTVFTKTSNQMPPNINSKTTYQFPVNFVRSSLTQTISEDAEFKKVWNMCFPRELMDPFLRQDKNIRRTKKTANKAKTVIFKIEHSY